MPAYATGADMVVRYDARRLGDLLKDDGTRDTNPAGNATLTALLLSSSGRVDSAIMRGGRYLPSDLAALPPGGNSQAFLTDLVCHLTFGRLLRRRGLPPTEDTQKAEADLELLAQDHLVLADVQAAVDSGAPVNQTLDLNVTLLSSIERVFGVNPNNTFPTPPQDF